MKNYLLIIPVLFLFFSCGTEKELRNDSPTTAEEVKDKVEDTDVSENDQNLESGGAISTDGVVRDKSKDGCGFVIEVLVDNVNSITKLYEPGKLPQEYQVDGKAIRFMYRMSRRPSKCTSALPIIIDKIIE